MKTKILILLLLLMFAKGALPQATFQKSFGSNSAFEYGYAMQATNDGGSIIGGCTFSYGGPNCHKYVVKFDAAGNELWGKAYSANQTEVINDIANTSDNGYIFCGYSFKGGADTNRSSIVRINSSGDTLWTKFWPQSDAYAITQANDGNVLVAGLTTDNPCDAFLIKLNGNTGDTIWTRIWGGSQQDWFYGIQETSDGGIILAGFTSSYGAGQDDVLLMKTDANGNALWERTYGSAGKEEAYGHCVQQTTDGGFILSAGSSTDSTVCLIKTDASGNLQWQKNFFAMNSYYSNSHAVQQTADKGYVTTGWKLRFPSGDDTPFILKTDSLGNMKWSKFYGGTGNDLLYAVKQTADGGYLACGRDYSFDPNGDVYLVKTDADGNSGCYERDTVFTIINKNYVTNNINLPLRHGKQTINIQTAVSSGYSEIPLCFNTGIKNEEAASSVVNVYPNPCYDVIVVSSTEKLGSVKIFNSIGKIIFTQNINDTLQQIDMSRNQAGIYFLQIQNTFLKIIKL